MTRRYIPGGTSGELLPSGEYVVNVKQTGLQTHLGLVAYPAGESVGILFPRCSLGGGFKFAGQRNSTVSKAAEYVHGQWVTRDDLPFPSTNWPLIYDWNGTLHSNPINAAGSQGYRYITPSNEIVTGDQTYGPFFGLSEYTYIGDALWIGQASDALAAVVYDGTQRRLLETGNRRFLVANRFEDTVTIAMADPMGVILIQTTMDELRALPVFVAPGAPAPTPVPVPPKHPEPVPMSVPDLSSVFAAAVNAHPELLAPYRAVAAKANATSWTEDLMAQHVALRQVLVRLGAYACWLVNPDFGLLKKEGGTHGERPQDGAKHAVQILMHRPTGRLVQVLNDSDPEWAPLSETDTRGSDFWIQPLPESIGPAHPPPLDPNPPTKPTEPAPSSPDLAALQAEIDAIKVRLAELDKRPTGFPSKIALRTDDGHYVCAESGGGGVVNATRTAAGAWETFSVEAKP